VQKLVPWFGVFDAPETRGADDNPDQKGSHAMSPGLAAAAAIAGRRKSDGFEYPMARRSVSDKTGDHDSDRHADNDVPHFIFPLIFDRV
jgi:hypothetical protein